MGWMPCPIEISAINSMWSVEKRKTVNMSEKDAVFDFNIGYIGTAILALIFCALGALIQFGSGEEVQAAEGICLKRSRRHSRKGNLRGPDADRFSRRRSARSRCARGSVQCGEP